MNHFKLYKGIGICCFTWNTNIGLFLMYASTTKIRRQALRISKHIVSVDNVEGAAKSFVSELGVKQVFTAHRSGVPET